MAKTRLDRRLLVAAPIAHESKRETRNSNESINRERWRPSKRISRSNSIDKELRWDM